MPAPVRIAAVVQFATAGLTAVGATLAVLTTAALLDAIEGATRAEGYGMDEASAATFWTGFFSYGLIGLWAAGALLLAVFAFGYRHEVERWTRMATWAFAIPVAILGVRAMARADAPRRAGGDRVTDEAARILDHATPDWWPPALVALELLTAGAYVTIVILLATPAARAWFGRPVEITRAKPA